jgi:DNA-binding NarL/FixJ family response regulator
MKHANPDLVLAAMKKVLQGGTYLSEAMTSRDEPSRVDHPGESLCDRMGRLTNRELHVFRLLGQGRSTQEIAGLLSVSAKTVGSHRLNMMAKLGIRYASRLVQLAIASNGVAGADSEERLAAPALPLESTPSCQPLQT